jgi:hypothetical protein
MADPLYLNLWFPSFEPQEMLPRALLVMRQFPFSAQQPCISYLALHPISWDEPTILERRFEPGVMPEEAIEIASDLLHEDYAYLFEAHWDLWTPGKSALPWSEQPRQVKFLVHGLAFDEEAYRENGHIQVDFGLDTPFLGEEVELTPFIEQRVRANVQKLVEFTSKVEKNCGVSGRVLWSESEENLAQKLISRLQKVQ